MSHEEYKAAREQLGLTQAGLAARLGLPRTAIVKREAGDQRITEEAALALRALSPARARRSGGSDAMMCREGRAAGQHTPEM
jgi:DNA-binding XRE family transcriptional regulator